MVEIREIAVCIVILVTHTITLYLENKKLSSYSCKTSIDHIKTVFKVTIGL